jgi:hypothetical protein
MRHALAAVLVAVALGCGDGGSKGVVVPLDQVPEPMLKVAREKLPQDQFDHARKLPNGNYEIRGQTKNGKVREIEFDAAGKIVEIE